MKNARFLISISFFLCLFFLETNAQTVDAKKNTELRNDTINKLILDNAKYRVYYFMEFSSDSSDIDSKTEAQTVLLLGSKYNAFLDYNSLRKDSIFDALAKSKAGVAEIMSQVLPVGRLIKFQPTIIKNYPQKTDYLFQQSIVSREEYRYTDTDVRFDWDLIDEEKDILGYKCKKAETKFRGRTYTAWYTSEIPLSEGPYVFSGLPGLIVEVSDSRDHYKFSMNGFNLVNAYDPIYLRAAKVVESSRADVRKAIENIRKDPSILIKSMGNATVSEEVQAKLKPRPHNPIELE